MKGKITFKGGTGSGNFGHSGRPGRVGGSVGGGKISELGQIDALLNTPELLKRLEIPEKLYHVTSADNLESIKATGLRTGKRASTAGEIKGVYLSDDPQEIVDKQGDILIRNPVVLEIDTSELNLRIDPEYFNDPGNNTQNAAAAFVDAINNFETPYALYSRDSIPASAIVSIKPYK